MQPDITLDNILENPFVAVYDRNGRFVGGNSNVKPVSDRWNNFRQAVEYSLFGQLEKYAMDKYGYNRRPDAKEELNILTGGLPKEVAGLNLDLYAKIPQGKPKEDLLNMYVMNIWDFLKEGPSPKNIYVALHEMVHKYLTNDKNIP